MSSKRAWYESWYAIIALSLLTVAAWAAPLVADAFLPPTPSPGGGSPIPRSEPWAKNFTLVVGGLAAVLWLIRAVAVDRRRARLAKSAQEAVVDAGKKLTEWARIALTVDDAEAYYRQIACDGASLLLPGKTLRVGMYIVEESETRQDPQSNGQEVEYLLWLAGDNDPPRRMSRLVTPDSDLDHCRAMVDRALNSKTLVVRNVTKKQGDWTALPKSPEQKAKYMSFISVPVERWTASADASAAQPAGLLCVDSKEVKDLTETELTAVNVLAGLMALGLNRLTHKKPVRPSGTPKLPQAPMSGPTVTIENRTMTSSEGGAS